MSAAAPRGYDRRPQAVVRPHDHDDRDQVVQAFALSTPYTAAQLLGLTMARRQAPRARVVRVLCPWHADTHPSCDLTILRGRLVARCRSCNAGGDVLAIVAAIEGLDARRDFGHVLTRAAELVGVEVRRAGHRAPERRPETDLDRARRELREARRETAAALEEARRAREELTLAAAEIAAGEDARRSAIAEAATLHAHAGLLRGALDRAADRAVVAEAQVKAVRGLLPRVRAVRNQRELAVVADEIEREIER